MPLSAEEISKRYMQENTRFDFGNGIMSWKKFKI